MSQHDLTIANQGFPAFRADLNDALQALGSCQSGTSAPTPTFANQLWYDTTNNILKIRNEDNDAWISIATLDQSGDLVALLVANTVNSVGDASISGLTVGKGGGAVANNTVVGNGALLSNTTANYITAMGNNALYSNTTGDYNTGIGRAALYANSTGAFNTGVGLSALYNNTTGSYNTAIGGQSLLSNSTASNNTAVGYQAGYSTTTGDRCVYVGTQAGYSGTTAISTAVGYKALYAATGTENTAFGFLAGTAITTGAFNTALADQSLYSNTTGSYNVAVGFQALANNTTASNNTAFGYQAAQTNTTGTSITAIGWRAGFTTNSTSVTMVGYRAGENSTGTENTVFGSQAAQNLSTGVGNLIIGASAAYSLTTGSRNTIVGATNTGVSGAGDTITTGSSNTILGAFNGNQNGLDIRTLSNRIVISDGAGYPRQYIDSTGSVGFAAYSPVRNATAGTYGVFIGTPADSVFEIASTGTVQVNNITASSGAVFQSRINGTTVGSISVSGSTTTYNTSSDYRLKENVQPMVGALDKLSLVKPVTYTWKINNSQGQGFIAHELAEIFPDAVTGTKDALDEDGNIEPQGVDYSKLVATLVCAVQELKVEIDSLKQQLGK